MDYLPLDEGIGLGVRLALAFKSKENILLTPPEIGHLLKQIEYLKSEEYAKKLAKV